jgi:hypothetical protein
MPLNHADNAPEIGAEMRALCGDLLDTLIRVSLTDGTDNLQ